uniref:Putative conserved secreted protein n=1 Tax=Nyssomyia neivai TaxID=330878 RepID=A0A1L8DNZ4_9DIPT
MNFFFIVGTVLLGSVAFAQEPTNNPLQDAYYIINSYHRMYEGTMDNVRFYLADTGKNIIDDCTNIVTDVIAAWDSRKASCPNWTSRNTEAIGAALRDCANICAYAVYDIQGEVYDETEEMQRYSLSMQTSVMRELREFNILENYSDFVDHFVQTVVDEAYDRLEHHYVPRLEDALQAILDAETAQPQQTQACVNAISRKFMAMC